MGEKVEEENKTAEGGEKKEAADVEEKEAAAAEEVEKKEGKADGGGEKKDAEEGGEKKAAEDGEKKVTFEDGEKTDDSPIVVVLKMDLHCEGCARKVRRAVYNFDGVNNVKAEASENKLIVTGNLDPEELREQVEFRTGKKVDLISPQPKKDGGGEKKTNQKSEKKEEEKKAEKPIEPVIITAVLIIQLHCQGCARKIKRTILKNFAEVETVKTDLEKNSVTVTGAMDVNELASFLEGKLKRTVEIVPPPKKDSGGGDKEKGKKEDISEEKGVAEEKKEDKKEDNEEEEAGAGEDTGEGKVEISKMAYSGFNPYTYYAMPIYNQSYSTSYHAVRYPPPPPPPTYVHHDHDYFIHEQYPIQSHSQYQYHQDYVNRGYVNRGYHVGGPSSAMNMNNNPDDRMFSDENPNGCSIM